MGVSKSSDKHHYDSVYVNFDFYESEEQEPEQEQKKEIETGEYLGKKRVGQWAKFFSDGNLKCVFNYNIEGKLHGEQYLFDKNGNLMRRSEMVNGKRIEEKILLE